MSSTNLDAPPPDMRPAESDSSALAVVYNSLFDFEVLDAAFHGQTPGIRVLAVTNRRLIMLESTTHAGELAFTSVPLSRVTGVSRLVEPAGGGPEDVDMRSATVVSIRVLAMLYEITCRDEQEAREAHDLIAWHLLVT
jgi:hypothetical protein